MELIFKYKVRFSSSVKNHIRFVIYTALGWSDTFYSSLYGGRYIVADLTLRPTLIGNVRTHCQTRDNDGVRSEYSSDKDGDLKGRKQVEGAGTIHNIQMIQCCVICTENSIDKLYSPFITKSTI